MNSIVNRTGSIVVGVCLTLGACLIGSALFIFAPIGLRSTGIDVLLQQLGYRTSYVAVKDSAPVYYDQVKAMGQGAAAGFADLPESPDFDAKFGSGTRQKATNVPSGNGNTATSPVATAMPTVAPKPKLEFSPESKEARSLWGGKDSLGNPQPVDIKKIRALVDTAKKKYPEGDSLAEKLEVLLKPCELAETKYVKMDKSNATGLVAAAEFELTKCNGLVYVAHNIYRFGKLMPYDGLTIPASNEILLDGLSLQIGNKLQGRARAMLDSDVYEVSVLPDKSIQELLPTIKVKLTGKQLTTILGKKADWQKEWVNNPSGKTYYASVPGGTGSIFVKSLLSSPVDPIK